MRIIATLIAVALSGCQLGYLASATWTGASILLSTEPVEELLRPDNQALSPDGKKRLRLVQATREYAQQQGLQVGSNFTKYAAIADDQLSWIVMGVKPLSFETATWWFPIVGRVPYLGFFKKEDAEHKAVTLQAEGFETSVRPADTFSTLGWFSDPILSTTLQRNPVTIASTILHESVHSSVWIPGAVPCNESAAQFLALKLLESFEPHPTSAPLEGTLRALGVSPAETHRQVSLQLAMAPIIEQLFLSLQQVYAARLSDADKLLRKRWLFANTRRQLHQLHPSLPGAVLPDDNNATLLQLAVYQRYFEQFTRQYNGDVRSFLKQLVDDQCAEMTGIRK